MDGSNPLKRQREVEEEEVLKRQKSYKDIITLLEEEEDEPNEDLSYLMSSLQEELSSGPGLDQPGPYEMDPDNPTAGSSGSGGEEDESEGERVMRHLLEASDDELGIPNTEGYDGVGIVGGQVDGGDLLSPVGGGLWEFEDHEAANYYNLLQSEVFL